MVITNISAVWNLTIQFDMLTQVKNKGINLPKCSSRIATKLSLLVSYRHETKLFINRAELRAKQSPLSITSKTT